MSGVPLRVHWTLGASAHTRRGRQGGARLGRSGLSSQGDPGRGSGWIAGGRGLPPVPAPHIRGPGRAQGSRRAGESGRVFPPPLGQASGCCRARPFLTNPAPVPARPRSLGACRTAAPARLAVSAGAGAVKGSSLR
jgi:hypothetical protein